MQSVRPQDPTATQEVINRRYRVVRCLGKGGMGDVCLVHDSREGDLALALKRIRRDRIDQRIIATLQNEFLALAALSHPYLTRVYDFGVDRSTGDLFFTAEFVDGINWFQATRALDFSSRQDIEVLMEMLAQVLRALEFIHCRGMVHGDIKPENLLVTSPSEAEGPQMKIIDFGLAGRERTLGGEKILGTPYYVAPETILGSQIDRRADLYSLGVVLYHIVTGKPPFTGKSNIEVLKSHIEKKPPPPQEAAPGLPAEIGDTILRLIQKRPADRFQSALELLEHLNHVLKLQMPLETQETLHSYLEAAALVGRENERMKIRTAFLATTGRKQKALESEGDSLLSVPPAGTSAAASLEGKTPLMVLWRGEKGGGKQLMAKELRHFVQTQAATFLAVECDSRLDYDLADYECFVEGLAKMEETWADGGAPPHVGRARSILEKLKDPENKMSRESLHAELEQVALGLLGATTDSALVIHFSDIHLGGAVLLDLVGALLRLGNERRIAGAQLLLTATALDHGEVQEGDFQRFCEDSLFRHCVLEVLVGRLNEEHVNRLLQCAFSGLYFPEAFVQSLLEECDGNLSNLLIILKHLLDKKKITRKVSGWELSKDYDVDDFPGRVRSELKERVSRLPPETLRFATSLACLGDNADPEIAARLADVSPKSVPHSVELLRREKILHVREEEGRPGPCTFVHSSSRMILYKLIPPEELAALHNRAGAIFEEHQASTGRRDPRILAYHYLRAGNREKGVKCGLEAARQLAIEATPLEAIAIYEQVLALLGSSDEKLAGKVRREIADLRFQVGDYRGVLALLGTGPLPGQVQVEVRGGNPAYMEAARAHARLGHFQEASQLLDEALRIAGKNSYASALPSVLLSYAELCLDKGDIVGSLRHAKQLLQMQNQIKDFQVLCQAHMLMGANLAFLNDMEGAAEHCQAALRLIDAQHDNRLLAWSLFCRGKYYTYKNQLSKALQQFQLALILRSSSNAFEGQAACLLEMGAVQTTLGRIEEAKSLLEKALRLYEKSENLAQSVAAMSHLAEVYRLLGETEGCHKTLREVLRRSGPLETRRIAATTLLTFAGNCIDCGDLPSAHRYLREVETMAVQGIGTRVETLRAMVLESELSLHEGRPRGALDHIAKGMLLSREIGDVALKVQLLRLQSLILCRLGRTGEARRSIVSLVDEAKRHELTNGEGWAKVFEAIVASEEEHENAEKLFSQAREIFGDKGSRRDLIHLQLEEGLFFLRKGKQERAYLDFEEGLYLAKATQLAYLTCQYHLALGQLEGTLAQAEASKAEENFTRAARIADEKGYPEIQWRARWALGKLLLKTGRKQVAGEHLVKARSILLGVLKEVPLNCRISYLKVTEGNQIDGLIQQGSGGGQGESVLQSLEAERV